jgi:hypothetical protein
VLTGKDELTVLRALARDFLHLPDSFLVLTVNLMSLPDPG